MTQLLPTVDTTSTLDAALAYAARGWRVFPLRADTRTPAFAGWPELATTDKTTILNGWVTTDRHGQTRLVTFEGNSVGICTGPESNLWVLDIDVKDDAGGIESFLDLEASYGTVPGTVEAVTGTNGRHLYFTWPADGDHVGNSAGVIGPGIDVRAWHGYVVAPPSVNAKTGQAYQWELDYHPDDFAPVEAPGWLVQLARNAGRQNTSDTPAATTADRQAAYTVATLAVDRFNWAPTAADHVERMLTTAGWQATNRDRDGVLYLTRPGKDPREGASATLGKVAPGVLWVFTSGAPPFESEKSYDPFDVLTLLHYRGDRVAADAQLVAGGWGSPSHSIDQATVDAWLAACTAAAPDRGKATADPTHLPDEFWNARPVLTHIRQAARSRLVAPDAVLGSVLTRIAAFTPHTVELPAIVGSPVGLTFYAAPTGPPSSGKSAAAAVARELVPVPSSVAVQVMDGLPIGSGEGFVDALFEMIDVPDPDTGKKTKAKAQTKFGAVFYIDEGSVLGDLGQRNGSTIMPTLRTAFTHGTLGSTNATQERRRKLEGGSYVYGVTMGIQPELAGPLLGDLAAGTPQRFLWVMATDPGMTAARIPWPGALPWLPPRIDQIDAFHAGSRDGFRRYVMPVDEVIEDEVRASRVADVVGDERKDDADAHRMLVRLKCAALLALLDTRFTIDLEDWALAATLVATSRAVRRSVETELSRAEALKTKAAGRRQAVKEAVVREHAEQTATERAVRSVARGVRNHHATHDPLGCTRGCLNRCISGRDRNAVDLDEVIAEAQSAGWLTVTAERRFMPGEAMPA